MDFSVLFAGARVEDGAMVRDSILMPGAQVKRGAVVEYSIVAENAVIGEGARVGQRPEEVEDKAQWGVAVIGGNVKVGCGVVVPPKAMIEQDV